MSKFPELKKNEFDKFLKIFSKPGALKFRNNKWVGLNRNGKPFTIHVKHDTTRKYPPMLIEAIVRDLEVTAEEFWEWYYKEKEKN